MAAHEQRGAFFFCSHLCLNVISSDDVSYGSQSGRGNLVVGVPVEKRFVSAGRFVDTSMPSGVSELT